MAERSFLVDLKIGILGFAAPALPPIPGDKIDDVAVAFAVAVAGALTLDNFVSSVVRRLRGRRDARDTAHAIDEAIRERTRDIKDIGK